MQPRNQQMDMQKNLTESYEFHLRTHNKGHKRVYYNSFLMHSNKSGDQCWSLHSPHQRDYEYK